MPSTLAGTVPTSNRLSNASPENTAGLKMLPLAMPSIVNNVDTNLQTKPVRKSSPSRWKQARELKTNLHVMNQTKSRHESVKRRALVNDLSEAFASPVEILEVSSVPPFILHPHSVFLKYWDGVLFFVVVYLSIYLPLRMGFDIETSKASNGFEVFLDIFFITDVCLRFRTGRIDAPTRSCSYEPFFPLLFYVRDQAIIFPVKLLNCSVVYLPVRLFDPSPSLYFFSVSF